MMSRALFLVVGLCLSCNPANKATAPGTTETLVKLERMGCRGYCPKYHLRIATDRTLHFNGERNVAQLGEASRKITVAEYDALKNMLQSDASKNLDPLYDNGIVDAPFSHVWMHTKEGERKISCRGDAPDTFERITKYLDQLAQADQWLEKLDGPRELLIELTDSDHVNELAEKFRSLDLQLVKRVSPRQKYFVYTADTQLVDASEILKLLQEDEFVKSVQWNKTINRRE